jgi:hypothetical protein
MGKVLKWKQQGGGGVGGSGAPIFEEYALGPLWELYEGVPHVAALVGLKSKLFAKEGQGPWHDQRDCVQQKEDGAHQDQGYHSWNGMDGIRPTGRERNSLCHFAAAGDQQRRAPAEDYSGAAGDPLVGGCQVGIVRHVRGAPEVPAAEQCDS